MFTLTKTEHDSGLGIYAQSRKVKSPRALAGLADDMAKWLKETNGNFSGEFRSAYAISHCQIYPHADPHQLFVVAPELVGAPQRGEKQTKENWYFPAPAIFNAVILERPEKIERIVPVRELSKDKDGKEVMRVVPQKQMIPNRIHVDEACMSFSHRKEKKVERFFRIKVRYQYLIDLPLIGRVARTKTEWVTATKAQVFQHECDHFEGKNIFFSNDMNREAKRREMKMAGVLKKS